MVDDLYPNNSTFFQSTFFQATEPIEQVNARKKAKAYMEEMQENLKGTITRLEERIAFYDSTKCIEFDPKTQPTEFMNES